MMEWEKPYMIECITKLNPTGDVLEIGFGLGYSATAIIEYSAVTSYTVIECCPVVWDKVEEFKLKYPEISITLVKGRWEDVLITLGKYDSIFLR
jgi:protein-L-isoaspartate O-methyltransferase